MEQVLISIPSTVWSPTHANYRAFFRFVSATLESLIGCFLKLQRLKLKERFQILLLSEK